MRTNLPLLNHFNLKQNFFERYIVLLVASIISSLKRRRSEIERVHEKEAVARIRRNQDIYLEFQKDFHAHLNEGYATCQILKEFDLTDIASGNFTEEAVRRAECKYLLIQLIWSSTPTLSCGSCRKKSSLISPRNNSASSSCISLNSFWICFS